MSISEEEIDAATKVIANLRYVDPMKKIVPISFYREAARAVLKAAAAARARTAATKAAGEKDR